MNKHYFTTLIMGLAVLVVLTFLIFNGCESVEETESVELFNAAVKAEGNSQFYVALELFDSLTRTFPETKYYKNAMTKRQSLKTLRDNTIKAWQKLQSIDLDLSRVTPQSEQFRRLADAYAQIDLKDVDKELANHIQESVGIDQQLSSAYMQLEAVDTQKKGKYTRDELLQLGAITRDFQKKVEEFDDLDKLIMEKLIIKYNFNFTDL